MGSTMEPSSRRQNVSESKRCRAVHRHCPKELRGRDLSAVLEADPNGLIPPPDFKPTNSSDGALIAFAQLTAMRLNAKIALISLLDSHYQYILAESGPKTRLTSTSSHDESLWLGNVCIPQKRGVCHEVLARKNQIVKEDSPENLHIIGDLTEHRTQKYSTFVTAGPQWRSYAGAPLTTKEGIVIGAICVFDDKPPSATMNHLVTYATREDHRIGERMIRGLTSFLEGADSLLLPEEKSDEDNKPSLRQASSSLHRAQTHKTELPTAIHFPVNTIEESDHSNSIISSPLKNESTSSVKALSKRSSVSSHGKESQPGLQESLLPAHSQNMFSRAANIMRQASELDGVMMYDASIAAVGGRKDPKSSWNYLHMLRNLSQNSPQQSVTTSEASSEDSADSSASTKRKCQVLGFSIADGSSIEGQKVTDSQLAEVDLRRLLRLYPTGKIFSFDDNGDALTSSDDSGPDIAPPSATLPKPAAKSSKRSEKQKHLSSSLLSVAPGAKSLCFLPLWDYERARWFAGCLFWTTQPNRYLSATWDLVYLEAFGNSIMTELSRLDEMAINKMKTTFVASISHELRSPLHGILGSVDFVQSTDLDVFQTSMIHSIAVCGRTLLDVINHVLDFAKINQYNTPQQPKKIPRSTEPQSPSQHIPTSQSQDIQNFSLVPNLGAVTEEVIEAVFASQSYRLARRKMDDDFDTLPSKQDLNPISPLDSFEDFGEDRKHVLVILEISRASEQKFNMPAGAWRRILMNLIGNALKYTESGHVKVSVKMDEVANEAPSKYISVTLVVEDSGIGMSAEFLQNRIYQPFTQENSFSTGIGLGLSLVRQIVESLNGKIEVKSKLQEGSQVRVALSLPRALGANTVVELDDDEYLSIKDIRERLRGRKICILNPTAAKTKYSSAANKTAIEMMGDSLQTTLTSWLGMEVNMTSEWVGNDAVIAIMLEPSFEYLAAIRRAIPTNGKAPVTLFLAIDAIEASTLRNDARVLSKESVVEVISQPCGPYKLAKVLAHCLDRHVSPLENVPYETPTATRDFWLGPATTPSEEQLSFIKDNYSDRTSSVAMSPGADPDRVFPGEQDKAIEENPLALIVDDNTINRRLLVALMRKHKIKYSEAVNGLEAYNLYKKYHSSLKLILMDLSMPVMDGMTSTRKIRSFETSLKVQRTAIIALTGLASSSARFEALESGVDHFMTKPVNFANLVKLIPNFGEGWM